ncbi:hypothetical protein V5N11_004793 [Cardamine amara subsp. amara]|uniref:Uncharacterized protein n=1 Tax=Cardamine amara subsp. amara TaxID=228776 RepID=A0ABD1BLN3_CARAN
MVTSTVGFVSSGFGGLVLAGYSKYCIDRLLSDVGMRSDVTKVPVERLVAIVEVMEGRLDNNNNNNNNNNDNKKQV